MIDETVVHTSDSARGLTQELHKIMLKRRETTDKDDPK